MAAGIGASLLAGHLVLVCLWPISAVGQEESIQFQAARSTRRATAYRRMLDLVRREEFRAVDQTKHRAEVEQTLIELINQSLLSAAQPPPLELPGLDQLGTLSDTRQYTFAKLYDQKIAECLKDLDPEKYGLEEWLREQCRPNQNRIDVVGKAQAQFNIFWTEMLEEAYQSAQKAVQEGQLAEMEQALAAAIRSSIVTAEDIERLEAQPARRPFIAERVREAVTSHLDEPLQQTVLRTTQQRLEERIDKLLRDALEQLDGRHPKHKPELLAHTIAGLERELAGWVAQVAARQLEERRDEHLLLAVKEFPGTAARVRETALHRFDERVAEITQRIAEEIQSGQRPVPEPHRERLRHQAHTNPQCHFAEVMISMFLGTANQTAGQMLTLDEVQQELLRLVSVTLLQRTPATPAQDGRAQPTVPELEDIQRDVQKRVSATSIDLPPGSIAYDGRLASQAWLKLQSLLKDHYLAAINEVRAAVANEQARKFSPMLLEGWKPGESTIRQYDPMWFDRGSLKQLPVWAAGRAPLDTQVLDETWKTWERHARDALELGGAAYHGQLELVRQLREPIARRMREIRASSESYRLEGSHWLEIYTEEAQRTWAERGKQLKAAAAYPQLFQAARQQIADTVFALLSDVPRQVQLALVQQVRPEIAELIDQDRSKGLVPQKSTYLPAYQQKVRSGWQHWLADNSWLTRETDAPTDLLPETSTQIDGVVSELVRAEVESNQTAQQQSSSAGAPAEEPPVVALQPQSAQSAAKLEQREELSSNNFKEQATVVEPPPEPQQNAFRAKGKVGHGGTGGRGQYAAAALPSRTEADSLRWLVWLLSILLLVSLSFHVVREWQLRR